MTTKTKKALALISAGSPHADIAQQMGLTKLEERYLIHGLVKLGYIEASPVRYVITEKGTGRLEFVPKSPRRVLDAMAKNYRSKKPLTAKNVVALARRTVVNSVWSLGAST